jgi:hypothetical protein
VIDLATGWRIDFIIASPASTAAPGSPGGSASGSTAWILEHWVRELQLGEQWEATRRAAEGLP